MRVTAIALDIDGTLTDPKRRVNLEAIAALRKAEERGVKVILVSGNVLPIAYGLSTFIGASGPVVAENGGVVKYGREVRVLGDRKEALSAYEHLKGKMPARLIFSDRWREAEVAIEPDLDLEEVKKELDTFNVTVETTGFAFHIFTKDCHKGAGLAHALKWMGIPVSRCMVVGDQDNDIPMIQLAGIGVAVANGSPRLQASADHVTKNEDGLGVAEAVERFILSDQ